VTSAPLAGLGPMRLSEENAHRLAAVLTAFGFGELYVPGGKGMSIEEIPFEGNPLTGDASRFARNVEIVTTAPQLAIGPPTIGWLYAACEAMREAADPDFGPAVKVPTLVIAAAVDRIVSVRAIETLAGELRAGAQIVIAGAEHEIMMERDFIRQQFWAAFDAFVPGTRLVGNRTEVFA
jgi:lysophospholipase